MSLTGMNVGEVRQLADRLRWAADELRGVVSTVDGRVTHSSWDGRDADEFKHDWWPGHRTRVLEAADHIQGLAQSARNNADEQERVSAAHGESVAGGGSVSAPPSGAGWWQTAAGVAGGVLATGGQLVTGLSDTFKPVGTAIGLTEIADWKILRDPHLPVSRLLSDIAGDGTVKFIGNGATVLSVGAGMYEMYGDFRQGDLIEGALDGFDTAADPFKTKSPAFYLGAVAVETYTDVVRDAREVDWHLDGDDYAKYMNPFVAKNWTETILPGAWDGLKRGGAQTLENLLP